MNKDEKKISKNREKKEALVAEVSEKMEKSVGLVFANYQGLTHQQIEQLKKKLKETDAELAVTKNTLLKIALEKAGKSKAIEGNEDALVQPTITLFAYSDLVNPLKQIAKAIKDFGGIPTIKFGILDNKTLTGEEVMKLSTLPPKEVLLAQVVGGLKSPIFGLHRALNWNLQKLAMTLKAIEAKKA